MSSQRSPPGLNVERLDMERLAEQDRRIRALLRRFVADPHAVDDLAQDTWLAALRHSAAARFFERAWLGRVAQNFAFQAMRGRARRAAREAAVARTLAYEPEDELDPEASRRVLAAVEGLAEPYRTALRLRFFDDLTPTAIADRLELPPETVRTRIRRALRQVQLDLQARR
jgi:RNA polymerase sigma-70 factor (ECF subfamily)